MLTPPQLFRPTTRVSVSLDLLRSAKPLRDRARVHFHAFTAETIADVSLLGAKQLQPGQSGLARLKLDDPLLLLPGDRFIVRQFSPVITIGGGRVLDAAEPPRRDESRRAAGLPAEAGDSADSAGVAAGAGGAAGRRRAVDRGRRSGNGWLPARVEQLAAELAKAGAAGAIGRSCCSRRRFWNRCARKCRRRSSSFTRQIRWLPGSAKKSCASRWDCGPKSFAACWNRWFATRSSRSAAKLVHAAGKGVVLRDEEAESKAQIEQAFASAGLKVPLLKDVLASLPVDKVRAQKIVTLLLRDRVLVKLADELVFHRDALEACASRSSRRKRRRRSSTSATSKTCSASRASTPFRCWSIWTASA